MPLIYKNGNEEVNLENLNDGELFDFIDNIPVGSEDELEAENSSDEEEIVHSGSTYATVVTNEILDKYLKNHNVDEMTLFVQNLNDEDSNTSYLQSEVQEVAEMEQETQEEDTELEHTSSKEEEIVVNRNTDVGSNVTTVKKKENDKKGKNNKKNAQPKELLWRKRKLGSVPSMFSGHVALPDEISNLQTPYQYFKYFFEGKLVDKIVEETIRYSIQKHPNKPIEFSKYDLYKYLGILILTSVVNIPNTRMYWNDVVGSDLIRNALSQKKFEKIRNMLHFNDNNVDPLGDKLHKLRPVINDLSARFLTIPLEEQLSVDEQICATKARHYLKQYLPLKPHKWGYKLFILSGVSGFCYNFEIYTGTENDPEKRLQNEPNLGSSSNTVVRLTRPVPRNCFYKLYFDNYYTSIPLITYLAQQGIHSLGTARKNRIANCKIPKQEELKKVKRGTFGEFVANCDGTDITNVYWKDNKPVIFLSSFIGGDPVSTVERYDRKNKEKVKVDCPAVVKQYNAHMGGVDLLDSIVGRYKIKMRSRKWYMRLFYHLIDITIINSWLLYRRNNEGKAGKLMKLLEFRMDLSRTLVAIGVPSAPKRGRPSGLQNEIEKKRKKSTAAALPPQDVRLDKTNHFPIWSSSRLRCKKPNCTSQTYVLCEKCSTALCFNKDKNCFRDFHKM